MPHPIYGTPTHELQVIHAKLTLPRPANGDIAMLHVSGETDTQRPSLWTYSEAWARAERDGILQPIDTLHWFVLAAAQDRPNTQQALQRALAPGGWQQETLPGM